MQVNIIGSIYKIGETEQLSPTFTKREFVIEDMSNPMYPKYYPFELVNEDTMLIDRFKVMDMVSVRGFINPRKYPDKQTGEERFFVSLKAKQIFTLDEVRAQSGTGTAAGFQPQTQPKPTTQMPPDIGPGITSGDKTVPF